MPSRPLMGQKGVIMKVLALPVGQLETNCYLLCDVGRKLCAVIDPGADADVILENVRENGCNICAILLTHGHDDHVGGVAGIRAACPDIPVYLNERDAAMQKPGMERLFPPVPDTVSYDEGDILAVGNIPVRVHATPGHTPGGVTIQVEDCLFTGDTLFKGSCGRTDLDGGDIDQELASLRRICSLPGDYEVYPGHMDSTTLERERMFNYYCRSAMQG